MLLTNTVPRVYVPNKLFFEVLCCFLVSRTKNPVRNIWWRSLAKKLTSKISQLFLPKSSITDAGQGPRHGPTLLSNATEDDMKTTINLYHFLKYCKILPEGNLEPGNFSLFSWQTNGLNCIHKLWNLSKSTAKTGLESFSLYIRKLLSCKEAFTKATAQSRLFSIFFIILIYIYIYVNKQIKIFSSHSSSVYHYLLILNSIYRYHFESKTDYCDPFLKYQRIYIMPSFFV